MDKVKLANAKGRTMHNKVVELSGEFEVQCKLTDKEQHIGYIIGCFVKDGTWQNFIVPLKTIDDLKENA